MAGNKYLHLVAGALTEIRANDVSAGVGDAGKLVALNGSGKIDLTMLPTGVGPDIKNMASGEDLAAGDFVYVDASGEANKADASDPTKFADGFVLAGVTAPAVVDVYFEGINDGVSGFTVGALAGLLLVEVRYLGRGAGI